MSGATSKLVRTEYMQSSSADQRILDAEQAIKKILDYHGCELAVTIIKHKGQSIQQHIVVIGAKEH